MAIEDVTWYLWLNASLHMRKLFLGNIAYDHMGPLWLRRKRTENTAEACSWFDLGWLRKVCVILHILNDSKIIAMGFVLRLLASFH